MFTSRMEFVYIFWIRVREKTKGDGKNITKNQNPLDRFFNLLYNIRENILAAFSVDEGEF